MRHTLLSLLGAMALLGGLAAYPSAAAADQVRVDIGVFYHDLAPYGHWIERPRYGWVWVPLGVPVSWRPYTRGHWVLTDDYGWLWVSDWAWGWAPFHYGRWVYDDDYGWIWIPGNEWAPAWVVWRYGDNWVGWAPLPPEAVWQPQVGFSIHVVEIERHIAPTTWVFVHDRDFVRADIHRYAELPARNVTIINRTVNVTNYHSVQGRIVDRGVEVTRMEKAAGQPIARYRVREGARPTRPVAQPHTDELTVYRPRVTAAPRNVRPPQPAPRAAQSPERLREQENLQRRELEQQQRAERQRLEQYYQRQLESARPAARKQEMQRREQTEMRVLDQQHRREQQLLQRRQERERKVTPQPRQDNQRRPQRPREER